MPILEGITVVALEQAVAIPFATRQLADLGARVIKVERPGVGDFARDYDRTVYGQSSYFVWLNRGKQSLALDIKDPDGLALVRELIADADVFVQNLAPGAVERLGLGSDELRSTNQRLITCAVSGYGPGGPYVGKKAYDLLVQCEAGLLAVTGTGDEPAKVGISVADIAAGMYAYTGILAALYDRERTGHGAALHVAMLDALGEWMSQPYLFTAYGGRPMRRSGAQHASIAPYGPYVAGDGKSVFLGIQNDREWTTLCQQVLHRPELASDPRFVHNPERVAHNGELTPIIESALADMTADDVVFLLDESGIANARLRSLIEFAEHPQLAARHRWASVDTPAGSVRSLLPPVTVAGQEPLMGPVPALGEHNGMIRREMGLPRAANGNLERRSSDG